ncbi:GNAT family N-acetyltransferase [Alphaproteobacteria bacterium KMM 3653]|uniref:GNAT family N-acetyltransferase n=1 Tax=Harenicola maris TaxID=2841044 RepID=A0AAP2CVC9_9RHOB|nr:GNAT family N-acetyltransferase [Harenicola maris]
MSVLSVRQLGLEDTEASRALRLEALRDFPEAFGGDYAEEAKWPVSEFCRRLQSRTVLGGFMGDTLAGSLSLGEGSGKMAHRGFVAGVYVTPAAQGGGLAQMIWDRTVDLARARGVQQLELCVSEDSPRAVAFYRRQGCEEIGRVPRALCVGGRYIAELQLVLPLSLETPRPAG